VRLVSSIGDKIGGMSVTKIVLFYVFTPLADPEAVKLWQLALAENCNLKGRVIISPDGINATLGGDIDDVKRYVRTTKSYAPFKKADIKWSNGQGDDFPRLSVKVRPELVTFTRPEEIKVTDKGVEGGGVHLKPGERSTNLSKNAETTWCSSTVGTRWKHRSGSSKTRLCQTQKRRVTSSLKSNPANTTT